MVNELWSEDKEDEESTQAVPDRTEHYPVLYFDHVIASKVL